MANGATPAICVRGLTKDYGRGRGVFDVSLEVGVGEALGFLGPNGAGKTVTMRHLMGFIKPQKGTVQILGHDCFRERPQVQASLGYLPGENACMREMTARSFLDLMAGMRGMRDRSRMLELVDAFGLDLGVRIGGMSKGNRQKVAIVAAFMARPDVLLLDEPTSGLDPLMQERFLDLVAEERARGAAILLSSHIFEEVGAGVRPGGVHPRGAGCHDLHHGRGPLHARPRLHGRVLERAGTLALGARPWKWPCEG